MAKSNLQLSERQEILIDLQDLWKSAFQTVKEESVQKTRLVHLHPSSLPYCALEHSVGLMENGIPTVREMDLAGYFFTGVGSVIHELLQNHLGRLDKKEGMKHKVKVYGNWRCKACNAKRYLTLYRDCPSCGGEMWYDEIRIKWRNVRGGIDKIIRVGNMLIVLDYKTTGTHILQKQRFQAKGILPFSSNVHQVKRYCALFKKQYGAEFKEGGRFAGCTVVGWILAYVGRDNPSYQREFIYGGMSRKDLAVEYRKAVKDSRHFDLSWEVYKKRKWSDLQTLVNEKPCASHSLYVKNMRDSFDPCPLGESKVCFDPDALRKKLKKIIKKIIKTEA